MMTELCELCGDIILEDGEGDTVCSNPYCKNSAYGDDGVDRSGFDCEKRYGD